MSNNYFVELNNINVNAHTEKKNNLTYLSWAWAWQEVKKIHPTATYKIYENNEGWNYFTDGRTAWVKTGVTINDIEHIEYLPVMDFRNKSIPLENITSFDVNKTIQRSLTKAVARHGLGLYIYAGEDLPEEDKQDNEEFKKAATQEKRATTIAIKKAIKTDTDLIKQPRTIDKLKNHYQQSINALNGIKSIKELSNSQIDFVNNLCIELFERGLEEEHTKLTELYNSKQPTNDDYINF
jgi:hypothetical protein